MMQTELTNVCHHYRKQHLLLCTALKNYSELNDIAATTVLFEKIFVIEAKYTQINDSFSELIDVPPLSCSVFDFTFESEAVNANVYSDEVSDEISLDTSDCDTDEECEP